MRDPETMAAALTASETGHLVFATLHTNNAPQMIDRIVDSFPTNQQNQIRLQLASTLLAIVSQRLLPRQNGEGRIAAFEVMVATPPVCVLIRDNKTFQLPSIIETSQRDGMFTLEYYMKALSQRGLIAAAEIEKYGMEAKRCG
jgi:twitching motility protein PilT